MKYRRRTREMYSGFWVRALLEKPGINLTTPTKTERMNGKSLLARIVGGLVKQIQVPERFGEKSAQSVAKDFGVTSPSTLHRGKERAPASARNRHPGSQKMQKKCSKVRKLTRNRGWSGRCGFRLHLLKNCQGLRPVTEIGL